MASIQGAFTVKQLQKLVGGTIVETYSADSYGVTYPVIIVNVDGAYMHVTLQSDDEGNDGGCVSIQELRRYTPGE